MTQTLIDLFSGCGGVTQGFKNRGYQVISAVEWDHITAQTYRRNHPEVVMYENDIRCIEPQDVFTRSGLEHGELTVLSACAPCQPFSRQNRVSKEDNRTKLVLETIKFIEVFQPQYFLMENVPGINKGKNKLILDRLIEVLRENFRYRVLDPQIVDAVNYGVPQFRKRLILLCSREDDCLSMPETTHASPGSDQQGKYEWSTVRDAFHGIHRLAAGQKSSTDTLHHARKHIQLNLERLKHIPKNGGSRNSLPEHLQLACHKRSKGFYDVYGRMDFKRPANTLTTGCTNLTKGRYAHPTANRAITPREAARLQTFPDDYVFLGNYDQISTQIGNAVPVRLAEVFAKYLHRLAVE